MQRLLEIEQRKAEILTELKGLEEGADFSSLKEELDSLNVEVKSINEEIEKKQQEENEQVEVRSEIAKQINEGEVKANDIKVEEKENMNNIELRNTPEYGKAFVNMILTGKDDEVRSLLSTNGGGTVLVPELLENEIKNAWANCRLMSLVKKTSFKGNVKVGFELSATGADVHTEGAEALDEEVLVWGSVELKAESIKKWITVSDEAIDGTTIDTLGEIYKEVAQRIAEKAEDIIVAKIVAAPAVSDAAHCGVPTYTGTAAITDIVLAMAKVSAKARNKVLVMHPETKSAYEAAALNANFGLDPFRGYEVIESDALKPYATATTGDTFVIAGDFGYGFQANFPNGNDMTMKVDDKSLAEKDLVKVIGRQYVGMGVVAPKAFVKIVK